MYSYYTETEDEASKDASIRINNVPIESPDIGQASFNDQSIVIDENSNDQSPAAQDPIGEPEPENS